MTISGVRLHVLLVAVAFSFAITTVLGKYKRPFFDPNCYTTDCSWSWKDPSPGTQNCVRSLNEDLNICPNRFPRPDNADDWPGPASVVVISDLNRIFHFGTGAEERYTCLSINYTIDQYVANKVKGLQLSIRGNALPDLTLNYCLSLNFSQGLSSYAVRGNVTSNQCFCGIKPGREYIVTVRTLPVDDNPDDPNDSKVVRTYETPAGCGDPSKVNDVRCVGNEQSRWKPKCINFDQQSQSGDYDIVEVSFDAAPDNFDFDKYQVFIYMEENVHLVDYKMYNVDSVTVVNKTCATSEQARANLLFRFNTSNSYKSNKWAEAGMFFVRVRPSPTTPACLNAEDVKTSCTLTESNKFSLIADPCKGNPCSQVDGHVLGSCTSNEDLYSCDCIPGYRFWQTTCIADPCQASNGQNWSRQCDNGECAYTRDQTDFYCNCNDNFAYLKNPKKCVADPCATHLDTNTTICGMYGKCIQNLTDDQVTFSCSCDEGYSVHTVGCKENVPVAMIVGVVIPSCLVGLLLFLAALCLLNHRKKPNNVPQQIIEDIITPGPKVQSPQPDRVYQYRRVLPIFSDDHPKHKEVVQCFCRLLQLHCKCDVSLLDWQKSIGPTVEMWLTAEIEKADIVLLLCSKGTGLKYKDKARLETPMSSIGVYGDVYLKALTLLDEYFRCNNAHEKFVVAYFDYSKESDIPISFRRFATYRLMQHMEPLFLRIHNRVKDSPHSCRRVLDVEESRYQSLEMGQPLHNAIESMKELIKSDSKWYQKHNNKQDSASSSPHLPPQHLTNSLGPQTSIDSAYDSLDKPQPPEGLFKNTSSGRSSDSSNFEDSLQQFLSFPSSMPEDSNAIQMHNHDNYYVQPQTRIFSDDIHLTMNADSGDPLQSDQFFSDIQMGNVGNRQGRSESLT